MPRQYSNPKFIFFLVCVISVQLWMTGCGAPRMLPVAFDPIKFTDKDVVEFNNRLTVMMQNNRNWNSIMRYVSTIVVVGAVASAGALGIAGVSADIVGYTALGGGFIGELQGIFKTRERANAYQQGVGLLYEASERFFNNIANENGLVDNDRLTKIGADLYTESLASLKLVEKALVSQIPTVAEVQKAAGQFQKFTVFPTEVKFDDFVSAKPEDPKTLEITIMDGGPVASIASQSTALISATLKKDNRNKVVLTLLGNKDQFKNDVEVKLINAQKAETTIKVKAPDPNDLRAKSATAEEKANSLKLVLDSEQKAFDSLEREIKPFQDRITTSAKEFDLAEREVKDAKDAVTDAELLLKNVADSDDKKIKNKALEEKKEALNEKELTFTTKKSQRDTAVEKAGPLLKELSAAKKKLDLAKSNFQDANSEVIKIKRAMANVEFEAAKKKSDEAQEKLDALPEDTNSNTKAKESPSSPIERPGKTSFTLEPMSPTRGSINSLQPE